MATYSCILARRISWTEEPGGYSPWGRKESDMTERLHFNQINEPLSASPISYLRTGGIVSSSIFPDLPSSPISQHLLIKNQEYRWMMTYHSLSPGKIAIVIVQSLSRVQLFATPWTVATRLLCPWDSPGKNTGVGCHVLLQGIFWTWQEYWSGLPCPSPGDLLDPGIEPESPALQADSLPPEPPGKPPAGRSVHL